MLNYLSWLTHLSIEITYLTYSKCKHPHWSPLQNPLLSPRDKENNSQQNLRYSRCLPGSFDNPCSDRDTALSYTPL